MLDIDIMLNIIDITKIKQKSNQFDNNGIVSDVNQNTQSIISESSNTI